MLRYSVSLVMLPIYTRYLTPEDYGVVELLSMLIDFSAIIFGARVGQSIFRYYCTADSVYEKNTIIASALALGFFLNGIGMLVVFTLSDSLALVIFKDQFYGEYIKMFSLTLLMLPLTEIPLVYIRAQQKPWLFFILSLLKLCIQVGLNIYLVVLHEMHVEGVIFSAVISASLMAIILTGYTFRKVGTAISISTCKQLFSFSLPLKLATAGSFYLAFGDRYILNMYTDLSQVGIYALGYKFGFIFTLIAWTPFEKAWDSEKYIIHNNIDAKIIYQRTFLYVNSALVAAGLFISIFAKDLLKIMSNPAFLDAYTIVPIIILAYIFQAWTKYCDLGILLAKKTMNIAWGEMFGVIIITIAYFTLIPAYGIYGAAWATAIGFFARFYWVNMKGRHFYDMELPWKKVIIAITLASIFFILSLSIPEDIVLSITLRIVLFTSFIIAYIFLPILSKEEKLVIAGRIMKLVRS